jgi:hypothetical protein
MSRLALFGNCYLWMIYGYLVGNFVPLFAVCAFGGTTSIIFMIVFYLLTPDRAFVYKLWAVAALCSVVLAVFAAIGVAGEPKEDGWLRGIMGRLRAGRRDFLSSEPPRSPEQRVAHMLGDQVGGSVARFAGSQRSAWIAAAAKRRERLPPSSCSPSGLVSANSDQTEATANDPSAVSSFWLQEKQAPPQMDRLPQAA